MLKIILYGYTQKVYSSRRIAQMVRENIPMKWLAGMQHPDHRTINKFRGERMPKILDDVLEQLLLQLIDAQLINLEHIFIDGTNRVGFKFYRTRKDKDGFKRDFNIYECEDCSNCPFSSSNRNIFICQKTRKRLGQKYFYK